MSASSAPPPPIVPPLGAPSAEGTPAGGTPLADGALASGALAEERAARSRAEADRDGLAAVLERITDAFFALDGAWRFTYVNDQAERLLFRARRDLLGRCVWDEFPEAVGSPFEHEYRRAVAEGATVEFQAFYPPLDAWFEVRAYPSADGLSVFFRDVTTQRATAEALEASERQLRDALEELRQQRYILQLVTDNATSALFMMDRDGHPTFMNPAATAITGYTLPEIRDFPLHYAVHHHHADGSPYPMAECPIDRALPENSDVRAHEDLFIRKDGSFFPVVCAASPIIEGGVPVGTVVEVRDVTAERAARDQLRLLTEAIPVQVWTATPDGMLDYVSGRVVEFFGLPERELLGDGWTRAVHPDDVPTAAERWAHALASGEPYEVEFRLRGADGAWRWHLARALPLRDVQGRVVRWFGSNTDIDDRRAAERARDRALAEVEAARENLFRAFDQAPAAISVTEGPDHVTTTQNALSRQLVGGRDLRGLPARDALPELEGQGFFEILDRVFATGEPFVGREMPVRWDPLANGVLRESYFDLVYQPLRDADGRITGILSHSVEVTAQVKAREELERRAAELARLAEALERSNRELDQFAYVTSHDLKAPLRGIANLAQWIEEDLGDRVTGESREHMRLLTGRVHRMEALIDGILTYSRAGRVRVPPEPVDTGALVRECVDLLAAPPTVRVEVAPDLPTLVVERVPLQQVFLNLLGNAVKHGAAGRPAATVRVTWRDAADGMVEFRVADDGPGIAPEFHERIWGIFQTLQARDRVEGTGIGLSVVQKIVESRGGRVWLESAPGAGTTFGVALPRTPRADAPLPTSDRQTP